MNGSEVSEVSAFAHCDTGNAVEQFYIVDDQQQRGALIVLWLNNSRGSTEPVNSVNITLVTARVLQIRISNCKNLA